jgi:hypothetical protein
MNKRKLVLRKESLRVLRPSQLVVVAGQGIGTADTTGCPSDCLTMASSHCTVVVPDNSWQSYEC